MASPASFLLSPRLIFYSRVSANHVVLSPPNTLQGRKVTTWVLLDYNTYRPNHRPAQLLASSPDIFKSLYSLSIITVATYLERLLSRASIPPSPSMLSLSNIAYFGHVIGLAAALSPNCAPGGNLDLSNFVLQLPIGSPGHPQQISTSQLKGCSGFQDEWFSTSKTDGAVIFKVPDAGNCVTSANSEHCRSELREATPASWSPNSATNRLAGDLKVTQAGSGSICIGQIHIEDSVSVRPVAELYYHPDGSLTIGVEKTRAGGNQKPFDVDKVTPGSRFTYEIRYEKNVLSVSINGKTAKTFTTFQLDAPASYFKVGNYNQGNDATEVHFYSVKVTH